MADTPHIHHLNLLRGDTIYYVARNGAMYSIRKTTIVDIQIRKHGQIQTLESNVFLTKDGHYISQFLKDSKDDLSPSQVFKKKMDAVQCIINCLHQEINNQNSIIASAQQRIEEAKRVLKNYEKYGQQEENGSK